jgi:hypothetical protein
MNGVERPPLDSSGPVSAARRGVGGALALFCFIVLAGSVTLWVRSYRRVDIVDAYIAGQRAQAAGTWRGGLFVFLSNMRVDNRSWRDPGYDTIYPEGAEEIWEQLDAEATNKWSGFGFTVHSKPRDAFGVPGVRFLLLRVPLWVIAVLAAPLPAVALRQRYRRWRWKRTNRCLNCGYDLRFTTGRCPECGELPEGRRGRP